MPCWACLFSASGFTRRGAVGGSCAAGSIRGRSSIGQHIAGDAFVKGLCVLRRITKIYLMTKTDRAPTILVGVLYLDYRDYQNARDASWRILLDCKIDRLPVRLNDICRNLKIRALTYGQNTKLIEQACLSQAVHRTDGLTFYIGETPIILFDEKMLPARAKFTVAHELGHIILGHVKPGGVTKLNREPHPNDEPEERAANIFAARLLAPACVLWGLDVHTTEKIMELCHISRQAAQFRAHRMEELYRRNKFLISPLEREVYQQFQPFIQEYRHPPREG